MTFVTRVALLSSILITANSPAYADTLGSEQATQLLARSQAVEEKCRFLTPTQHEELSTFVAKAEIAMVAKSSVAATKTIMASGKAQGKAAACSDGEHNDVVDIISAAHQATSAKAMAMVSAAEQQPVVEASPVKTPSGALGQYAELTQRYYLARRCNLMSFGVINSLYKTVVSTHHDVVASFGVPAVRAVMLQSESRANGSRCS